MGSSSEVPHSIPKFAAFSVGTPEFLRGGIGGAKHMSGGGQKIQKFAKKLLILPLFYS